MKSESRRHYARRARTIKRLGEYQQSLGKNACVPNYSVWYQTKDEPCLFSDEQMQQFFASADSEIKTTDVFPYNDLIFLCFFRMQYCCGMRSSEVCNLTVGDVDLSDGTVSIYRSKGFMDGRIYMSDDLLSLCRDFDRNYSSVLPERKYFFRPISQKLCYNSGNIVRGFDSILKKAGLLDIKGKNALPTGCTICSQSRTSKSALERARALPTGWSTSASTWGINTYGKLVIVFMKKQTLQWRRKPSKR